MKKLMVLFFAFSITLSIAAQHTNFGVKAGYNAASVEVSEGADFDSKSGLHVGALAHIHISEHFAVQPELVFSCQGGESGTSKLKLNYLNLPVLAQYMISNGFRLQTGPQLGFLLSASQTTGNIEVDLDESFKSVDFSWVFGAGYIFSSGIGIDARYNLGLSDISELNNYDVKNRVFQVGLFYQFHNYSNKKK
ncbi:MAG TPA: porin family protein [Chitinophagaceae bacterium]|nr:porin family protein [Chitinophagaceae bacterium]